MDLPSDIIQRPLVKQLFTLGEMEVACQLLLRWAGTSHGATENDGQSQTKRKAHLEKYWREAFKLYFYSTFKNVVRADESEILLHSDQFPTTPFHGATWKDNFMALCREINVEAEQPPITAMRKRHIVARFQKVEWTQRKLDTWLDRFLNGRGVGNASDHGSFYFPRLTELLRLAGANENGMPRWHDLDSRLATEIRHIVEFGDLNLGFYNRQVSKIKALLSQGAETSEDVSFAIA